MREVMIAPKYSVEVSDFEDGVFQLIGLQGEVIETMQAIKDRQKALVIQRFKQGATICAIAQNSEYGESLMDRLSQATGISVRVLYEARQFYNSPKFGQSMMNLELWFDEQEAADKPANWSRIRNYLKEPSITPESRAADFDRRAHELERKAQQMEFEAEKLEQDLHQFGSSEHVKSQALGVATKAVQVAREKRDQVALMDTKPERITNSDYLDFIRSQPCCVTGMTEGVHPHHFLTGGMGTKGSDFATVPLYHELHRHLHDHGQDGFQEEYDMNFKEEMARLMHLYFVGVPPWKSKSVDKRAA